MNQQFSYQLIAVLSPRLADKEKAAAVEKIESTLTQQGLKVGKKEEWGTKDLAYSIKKFTKGNFWMFDISAESGFKPAGLNTFLNRDPEVIRYLLLKN